MNYNDFVYEIQKEEKGLSDKYRYLMRISANRNRISETYERWRGIYMFMRRVGIPTMED